VSTVRWLADFFAGKRADEPMRWLHAAGQAEDEATPIDKG
jgi:hypothetical protein